MMEIIKLSATRRGDSGKGSSHRLRREGKIPAIAYGKELKALSVAVLTTFGLRHYLGLGMSP